MQSVLIVVMGVESQTFTSVLSKMGSSFSDLYQELGIWTQFQISLPGSKFG